jgi:hypothetical protein
MRTNTANVCLHRWIYKLTINQFQTIAGKRQDMAGNAILNVFNDHLELLGFTDDEALDSLNDQGITSYSALLDTYNRKDGFDNLWKRLASPGGTMADPNHNG